jgi:hypothetical protein
VKVLKSQAFVKEIGGQKLEVSILPLKKLELSILGEKINNNLGSVLLSPQDNKSWTARITINDKSKTRTGIEVENQQSSFESNEYEEFDNRLNSK